MKIEKISLIDSKGGLNDRDLASGIAQNEFQVLENYLIDEAGYLQKRPGKDILQFTTINPQPFVSDDNTIALWHLDETVAPWADSSGNGHTLQAYQGVSQSVAGIFSNAQRCLPAKQDGDLGGALYLNNLSFDGMTQLSLEGWIKIDVTFTGKPVYVTTSGFIDEVGNDSSGILTTFATGSVTIPRYIELTAHRDWDTVNLVDSGGPYLKFSLQVTGSTGIQSLLRSPALPVATWIHVRVEYSALTGLAQMYINGSQVDQKAPIGGGAIYAPGFNFTLLGARVTDDAENQKSFNGILDEFRISNVIRGASSFPFENPRGLGFEFAKSDGTRQAVISADDSLWYTLGDGAWTQMKMYADVLVAQGFTTPSFSRAAYWDAIFRKDVLYLSNGVDKTLAWDGSSLVEWLNPQTPPLLSASATLGTITNGLHQVWFTYLYGSLETGLSPAASITIASAAQINVGNIPPRHANCTGVRIYMSKAGATDPYLVRQIAHTPGAVMSISGPYTAGSSPGYATDSGALGPADTDLGSAAYPFIEAQVATALSPKPQFLLGEHDRAFMCGMLDDRYTLRWSELGAFDVVTVFSFSQAAANQGNLIALASYYGEVHCSKDGRATLILRGANPQNWTVLETLHPSVGAIDHWSYVHRYPFSQGEQGDQYVLCFAARDGFYMYAGQQIVCISDKIKGTIERLASGNATRNEWDVTTQAQWQAQTAPAAGGTATANIQAARYETDGLRQIGGTSKIVNQLDYLGLWNSSAALVAGNVISVCKGVNEGEFYFGTDAASTLWWTGDNFQTAVAVSGNILAAGEVIIQLVKRATDDFYFLITDTPNADGVSSGGGNIYSVGDPLGTAGTGPAWTLLTSAALYYDLDVPIQMSGAPGPTGGRTIGNGITSTSSPYNIFINHRQNLRTECDITASGNYSAIQYLSAASAINTAGSVTKFNVALGSGSNTRSTDVMPGFYAYVSGVLSTGPGNFTFDNTALTANYTRREFPLWRGGTFSPQAYWDVTNSRLVFLASTPQDGNLNRSTYLRTITAAGVLVNHYTAFNISAFTTDGISLWMAPLASDSPYGFNTALYKSSLAAPGTVTIVGPNVNYTIPLRLSYNAQNPTVLAMASKYLADNGPQDFWSYKAYLQSYLVATCAFSANISSLTRNGDSGGVYSEFCVQTTTPYRTYVLTSKINVADSVPVYVLQPVPSLTISAYKSQAYQSPFGSDSLTGILCAPLFVPASGVSGGNLWSDRLYFMGSAAVSTNARFVQLGIPGNWTVIGIFQSEQHNLGPFSAFDDFESDFSNHNNSGGLLFELRNAADPASLATAVYQQQTPNSKITAFAPVQNYVQWRLTFTWTYDSTVGAAITDSPSADFVIIGFFLGSANLPRTVAFHWKGRTFWACAEDGSTYNNVVLVYQKSNSWTKFYNWNMKSIFRFRNQMVGLEYYQLVRLMDGTDDAGQLIVATARTGTIMGFVDKMLSRLQANISAFANNLFSSNPGYVKVTPYQGNTALSAGAWVLPVPNGVDREPNRVLGVPNAEFFYAWARAFSLEVKTSEDTTGPWIPYYGQPEDIQQIDLELETTGDSYDIVVK